MPASHFRRRRLRFSPNTQAGRNLDHNEAFVLRSLSTYMERVYERYPVLDRETLEFIGWLLGPDIEPTARHLMTQCRQEYDNELEEEFRECRLEPEDFPNFLHKCLRRASRSVARDFSCHLQGCLRKRRESLKRSKQSGIEKNADAVAGMFGLDPLEKEFMVFAYILSSWREADSYFVDLPAMPDRSPTQVSRDHSGYQPGRGRESPQGNTCQAGNDRDLQPRNSN